MLLVFVIVCSIITISKVGERWKAWDDLIQSRMRRDTPRGWQDVSSSPNCTLTNITTNDALGRRASMKLLPAGSQGNCGSCWAFAITHAFADHLRIASASEAGAEFSADHLARCNPEANEGNGCCGSDFENALEYLQENGFATSSCLPYSLENYPPDVIEGFARTAATTDSITREYKHTHPLTCPAMCRDNSSITLRRLTGFSFLITESEVMEAVRRGPVIAAVRVGSNSATSLLNYRCGVYVGSSVSATTLPANHAVEIVDYSVPYDGVSYWVVKNTWGMDWGEGGYFRVARDRNQFQDFYALNIGSTSNSAQSLLAQNPLANESPASLCGSQKLTNLSQNILVQNAALFGVSVLSNRSLIVCGSEGNGAAELEIVSIINATWQIVEGIVLEIAVIAKVQCSRNINGAIISFTVMTEMDNSFSLLEYNYDFQPGGSSLGIFDSWYYLLLVTLQVIYLSL